MKAPEPVAPAPVAPAPGPQAAYNPESDLPGVNANIAQDVGAGNTPGGFRVPGGPAPAAPTAAPTPAAPQPNPYGEVNPNAPQFIQHLQGGLRGLNTEGAFRMIQRQLGGGMLPDATAVSNYFAGSPEKAAAMQAQSAARSFYDSPRVQAALRANPQLLLQAEQNPLGFYQANKDALAALAARTQPIVVEGADGKPISINITAGESDPNMLGASKTTGLGLRTSMAEKILSAPPGTPTPTPDTNQYLLEPSSIGVQQKQIQDQFKTLQTMWTRAQKLRDNATMTNIELKMMELRSGNELLNGVKAITEFSAGRPEALASTLNRMSGGAFMLQPRPDGKYNVYSGDTLTGEGVTKEELIAKSRMIFDQQFQTQVQAGIAANKARADKIFEARIKGLEEAFKQEAAQNKDINVEIVKARLKREFPETDYHHVPDPTGNGVYLYDKKNPTKPVAVMTLQKEIGVGGKPVLNPDGTPRMIPQITKTN
jgi:hypothetical protein